VIDESVMRRSGCLLAVFGAAVLAAGVWWSGGDVYFAVIRGSGGHPGERDLWIGGALKIAGVIACVIGIALTARGRRGP
jgi:hypothetical protein